MAETNHVLLVHGWSARDVSMKDVAELARSEGYKPVDIRLGAYPSMEDDLRAEDAARRMTEVIADLQASGQLGATFHVIVHSTGAFVVRQWIVDNFPKGGSPVRNFLMLAPANFGSPLAHRGRSLLGRLVNLGKNGWQTGAELLHQLELGSAYQEELALRDRLSADSSDAPGPYSTSANGTRPFVIVGLKPVEITTILDEWAWDGTVRAASAHFDPRGVTMDFANRTPDGRPTVTRWSPRGLEETAFAVLPDRTHLSIIKPRQLKESASPDPEIQKRLSEMILQALKVSSPAQYRQVVADWKEINLQTRKLAQRSEEAEALRNSILPKADRICRRYHEHYQIVVHLDDDIGERISEYHLWFGAPSKSEDKNHVMSYRRPNKSERIAHRDVIKDAHRNRRNGERRVLHLDRMELMRKGGYFDKLTASVEKAIAVGATAIPPGDSYTYFDPDPKRGSELVTLRAEDVGGYDSSDRFLKRYATHFMRVIAPRYPSPDAFKTRPLSRV